MSRPATLKVGNTSYWTIMTYTSAGVLVDADSVPTVVVYKNGSLTADVVTITKRSATTGIYDAYYNPASEAEGDCFTIQETATISSQAYVQSWNFEVLAAERGTDNSSPSRYYTFADSSGTDYVDVYTEIGVVKNLPKVQKAIVRLKLSGTASSSSDWRLKLHVPSGNPSSGFDLLDGVTLPTSVSSYILQAEVDINSCDNVDGSWSIVFEDFNSYGSVLSIDDAAVEFSDVPIASVGGDATAANQTAISNAIAGLNDFDPASQAIQNVVTVGTVTNAVTTDSASRTAAQADVSALATASEVASIDALVDEIKAVTDNLPNSGSLTDIATAAAVVTIDSVADSILVIANKLDSAMEADGPVSRFTTNALEQTPSSSGGDATASNQLVIITHLTDIKGSGFASTDTLEAIRDRGDAAWITGAGSLVGPGAIPHTVTVNSSGSPVDGAEVWVSTDAGGANVIAGTLSTDAFGQVTFTLDAGSYYLWSQKAGVNFTNPTAFTVS